MAEVLRILAVRYCVNKNYDYIQLASNSKGFYAWNEGGHHIYVPFSNVK